MKIDDLIKQLTEIREAKGNVDVAIDVNCTEDGYYSDVYTADNVFIDVDGTVLISCWDENVDYANK